MTNENKTPYSLQELDLESTIGVDGEEILTREIRQIDMSDFANRQAEIADQLWLAATETGFFQLYNHGLSQDYIEQAFAWAERFFALPEATKEQYPLKPGGLNAGWETRAQVRPSTKVADQKESFQLTRAHMEGVWPKEEEIPGFQRALLDFEHACWQVGMRVLSCFALKLGFDEDFFTRAHDPEGEGYQSTLRLLHYYPISEDQLDAHNLWRAGAHTDFDCLTLLFQKAGQGGLQLCPGREAQSHQWTSVEPLPGVITCNIGDMLMRWSDDQLKSTLHRVRKPKIGEYLDSRYSLAFFCQANKPVMIQGPQKTYEPISAEDYLKQRIAANFGY